MEVILINYTPQPELVVTKAAKTCYSTKRPQQLDSQITEEEIKRLIPSLIKRGHHSVLEHANFTFHIYGISRVASHQLVRHRIASFSQQSQRFTQISQGKFVIPPIIEKREELKRRYEEVCRMNMNLYKELIKEGINVEDARYILPQAVQTQLITTMNARELLLFFSLRCCMRAQWEIRELAFNMLKEVYKVAPIIFSNGGPACWQDKCREEKPCDSPPKKEEFFK
jgi:thymidylate synthase (FAD)